MGVSCDKGAVIQRDKPLGESGFTVGGLLYTTILPSCPKLMLNVESGDYGVLVERPCECPFGEIGLLPQLHSIRGYENLTSEGMAFLGGELLTLVEQLLPARFGGHPTDYQFVEEEPAPPRFCRYTSCSTGDGIPYDCSSTLWRDKVPRSDPGRFKRQVAGSATPRDAAR